MARVHRAEMKRKSSHELSGLTGCPDFGCIELPATSDSPNRARIAAGFFPSAATADSRADGARLKAPNIRAALAAGAPSSWRALDRRSSFVSLVTRYFRGKRLQSKRGVDDCYWCGAQTPGRRTSTASCRDGKNRHEW